MFRNLAVTAWRAAVLFALLWIGWQLQALREEIAQPVDEQTELSAGPDAEPAQPEDDARAQLALLNQKLDAIMAAMVELKR